MGNKFRVNENYSGQRLDNFLFREYKNIPKSLIYRLIRKGAVKVNNKKKKPDYKLLLDDQIFLPNIEQPSNLQDKTDVKKHISQDLINIVTNRIIYESNDFLILNKPSGMAVHAGGTIKVGIIDILRKAYDTTYLELVHRLDRDTSGCLVIAKTRQSLKELHSLLRDGQITKKYLALCLGNWDANNYPDNYIEHKLRRSALQGGERIVVVDHEDGKSATTKVKIKANYNKTCLLELMPITGRTHQLRVHLSYEQHPIIGDSKYGNKEVNKQFKLETGLNRVFLHAHNLTFKWDEDLISVTAPLDNDLEKVLKCVDYI